jgi:hypothetical protein
VERILSRPPERSDMAFLFILLIIMTNHQIPITKQIKSKRCFFGYWDLDIGYCF